ncbi:MAG: hypothetical protein A2252_06510 [Elusimicrobia bacterium RIFOXYA2_FULL_39_19]|nr:MAG: hypothetical protein A2252_06510 [Elusimicrobia bacterium RIFOXYA2_FULL_39_19]
MKFRKSSRIPGYNYKTNGYYFVTIVTRNNIPLLKTYKTDIEQCIVKLPDYIGGLKVDYYTVMDNHIHLIFSLNNCVKSLGQIVKSLKHSITRNLKTKTPYNISQSHSNATATNTIKNNKSASLWEWNYYEHIIRNEKALYSIRKYIQENPLKESINWDEVY